ncbi:SLBB domain-containing protein [Myxococcota bacterium]|nr:SLBB domain-containing protein [Myxococcota bacterium]
MRLDDLARRLAEARPTEPTKALAHERDTEALDDELPQDEETQQLVRFCTGTACTFAGGPKLRDRLAGIAGAQPVRCLGTCHDAPAAQRGHEVFGGVNRLPLELWSGELSASLLLGASARRVPRVCLAKPAALLRRVLDGKATPSAAMYELPSGEEILRRVEALGLHEPGRPDRPHAARWRQARAIPAERRFVVARGDEGEPGSFLDRVVTEDDPHAVLAGLRAAARAADAREALIYLRAEYVGAHRAIERAIHEAHAAGWLGDDLHVELVIGQGPYICGEEASLLRAIELDRPHARPLAPFPVNRGLRGSPTVVHSVESLLALNTTLTTGRGQDRRLICVSGAVRDPGVVEVLNGMTVGQIIDEGAGGLKDGVQMVLVGGPRGRVLNADELDLPLDPEHVPGMGYGSLMVLSEEVTPRALAAHLFEFTASESCGACTACRVGASLMPKMTDREALITLMEHMSTAARCGFGRETPRPVLDLLRLYPDELFPNE